MNGENKQKTREAICSIRKIAHLTLKLHFLLQSNLTLYIKGIQRIKRVPSDQKGHQAGISFNHESYVLETMVPYVGELCAAPKILTDSTWQLA